MCVCVCVCVRVYVCVCAGETAVAKALASFFMATRHSQSISIYKIKNNFSRVGLIIVTVAFFL